MVHKKIAADESGKMYYNAVIKGDLSSIKDLLGDEAELEFTVDKFDLVSIINEVIIELGEKYSTMDSSIKYTEDNYKELQTRIINDYMELLTTKLKNYEPDTEAVFISTFKKRLVESGTFSKKEFWTPKSNTVFEMEIMENALVMDDLTDLIY